MGELYLAESAGIDKDKFSICIFSDGMYLIKYQGELADLADQWAASGISDMLKNGYIDEDSIHIEGRDVYFIVNPEIIPDDIK